MYRKLQKEFWQSQSPQQTKKMKGRNAAAGPALALANKGPALTAAKSLATIPLKSETSPGMGLKWMRTSTKLLDKMSAVPQAAQDKLHEKYMPKVYVRRDSIVLSQVPTDYDIKLYNLDK